MKHKTIILTLTAVIIAATVSGCGLTAAKDTISETTPSAVSSTENTAATTVASTETSTAVSTTGQTVTQADSLMVSEIIKPLTGMFLVYGKTMYGPETMITNDQAIEYLCQMVRLYYSDRAEDVDALGTQNKYVALDEAEVSQLLDEAFGGRYTTAELLTDNTLVTYNAHMYYIPLQDTDTALQIIYSDGNAGTNQYTFKVSGQGMDQTLTMQAEPSKDNTIGFSIVSFHS